MTFWRNQAASSLTRRMRHQPIRRTRTLLAMVLAAGMAAHAVVVKPHDADALALTHMADTVAAVVRDLPARPAQSTAVLADAAGAAEDEIVAVDDHISTIPVTVKLD